MGAQPKELTPDLSARHLFGAKMRKRRTERGWSLDHLSAVVNISKAHLSRLEHATTPIPPDLATKLDAAFNTATFFQDLYALARREVHPDKFRRRMELEERAVVIREYTPQIVPGLVQTEAYAAAAFRTHMPTAPDGEIKDLVAARMSRQATILRGMAPDYGVILDEAVLHRGYGGPTVMREQLSRLLRYCEAPGSLLQVLPLSYGGHGLAGGSVSLWTLDTGDHVAYEESVTTGTLIEEPGEVRALMRAYERLCASALSPTESAEMISSAMEVRPT